MSKIYEKAKKYLPNDKLAKLKEELSLNENNIKFFEANREWKKYRKKFGK